MNVPARFSVLLVAAALPCATASAGGPGPRAGHTLVYDSAAKRTLLVDGFPSSDRNADDALWEWDGSRWRELDAHGPRPRTLSGVAFDSSRGVLVVYGGLGIPNGNRYGDTWEWDGRRWVERRVQGPGPRDHHAMVYDAGRKRVVVYGGVLRDGSDNWPSETWEWDGSEWRKFDLPGPGSRVHHAMAYDPVRKLVLLYGGFGQDRVSHGDLWGWDGASWRLLSEDGPGVRSRHRMAFDESRGELVLYGGNKPGAEGKDDETGDDTWVWDGRAWAKRDVRGLGRRRMQAMTYDPRSKLVLLYGGNADGANYETDLWGWDGASWRRLAP